MGAVAIDLQRNVPARTRRRGGPCRGRNVFYLRHRAPPVRAYRIHYRQIVGNTSHREKLPRVG